MVKPPAKSAKPAKTAVTKPRKVFDVSGSGKGSAASATNAKRVIISHHPIMKDPEAVAPDVELPAREAAAKNPTAAKIVIKPLSENEKSVEPKTDRIELNIPDFDAKEKPTKEKPAAIQVEDADKSAEAAAEPKAKEVVEPTPVEPTEQPAPEDETADTSETPAPEPPKQAAAETEPVSQTVTPDPSGMPDIGSDSDKTKEEQEAAALEAEVKRQEEFDKLVESKEYFLPITTAERRRSKLVTITGLILIVLLGLLLVNLLLDVGTIQVNGVEPLTHFFGS